jgi:hypothetical protein
VHVNCEERQLKVSAAAVVDLVVGSVVVGIGDVDGTIPDATQKKTRRSQSAVHYTFTTARHRQWSWRLNDRHRALFYSSAHSTGLRRALVGALTRWNAKFCRFIHQPGTIG